MKLGSVLSKIIGGLSLLGSLHAIALPNDYLMDITESTVLERLDQENMYSFAAGMGLSSQEQAYKARMAQDPQFARLKSLRLSEFFKDQTAGGLRYGQIEKAIRADVDEFTSNSGVKSTYSVSLLSESQKERPRHFDYFWLRSQYASFKLVAVINRLDRKDFDPSSCGELRFIYRLGYNVTKVEGGNSWSQFSMMPVFLNFVYKYKNAGQCGSIANSWKINRDKYDTDGMINLLVNGPLRKDLIELKQIELNMQMARFSSGDKTDFGGSAVYLFRIFAPNGNELLKEVPLENTPDVTAILRDPALKASLRRQITDPKNIKNIDQGIFQLENTDGRLLAKKALSFSTTGRARLGNKPYAFLFLQKDSSAKLKDRFESADWQPFSQMSWTETDLIKSPLGLLERMDSMTCMGCHQTASTAGFHVLGRHFDMDTRTNRTALAFSPHAYAERVRRANYTEAVALGRTPNIFRPLPVFADANWNLLQKGSVPTFAPAKIKELCLEPGQDLSVGVACGDATAVCRVNARNSHLGLQYGECMLKSRKGEGVYSGLSCREGEIVNKISSAQVRESNLPFNFFSFKDRFYGAKGEEMPSEVYNLENDKRCGRPFGGIPLGRVASGCNGNTSEGRLEWVDSFMKFTYRPNNALVLPDEICAMRGGNQFDTCAGTDRVTECLSLSDVRRTPIDLCHQGKLCREDYLCQQLPLEVANEYKDPKVKETVLNRILELNRRNIGFCVPNYFVFNMRIDGHPLPEGRR